MLIRPPRLRSSRGDDGLGHIALAVGLFLVWTLCVITIVSVVAK